MRGSLGSTRVLSRDLGAHAVPAPEPSTADALLATTLPLLADDDLPVSVGLWEAGPGTDEDVEADEVFLVLAGAGVVTFEDGSSIELGPGVLVRLHAGDRTTWHITERLRKLYIA